MNSRPTRVAFVLRVALAGLLAAAAFVSSSGSAQAATVGVNVNQFPSSPANYTKMVADLNTLDPAWVRVFLSWDAAEPSQGNYDAAYLSMFESFFAALPANTKVDVEVVRTPSWASGGGGAATPPTDPNDYGAFMNYLANAFGSHANAYEIWNEEDNSTWWTGSAAQYAALLEAAYPAVKTANPNALVMLGGLTANNDAFLSSVYAAGAHGPGTPNPSFDAVATHTDNACDTTSPYTFTFYSGTQTINHFYFLGFTDVESVMAANGDASVPIYMTELGWPTETDECPAGAGASAGHGPSGVDQATQASFLTEAYHCLDQPAYSYVAAGFWYALADTNTSSNDYVDHYGLLTSNYVAKPSFAALTKESQHGDQLTGACGNFVGPSLTLKRPHAGQTYTRVLRITVTATDPTQPLASITIEHDGRLILHFNARDAKLSDGGHKLTGTINWVGARKLTLGDHTISATARDTEGVATIFSVIVDHVKAKKHHHHG